MRLKANVAAKAAGQLRASEAALRAALVIVNRHEIGSKTRRRAVRAIAIIACYQCSA